ncbi:sodium-coupled monocarboxylate transporter 1-like isoform X2 [Rhodnius prolixus]
MNASSMNQVGMYQFDWAEYTVFAAMMGLSALTGVYFGFIKGGQNTVSGYMLGGKQMTVFPIAMSLISSFTSSNTLLGVPWEIYTYGSQYLMANFANIALGMFSGFVILPVFYKLQLISLYEYFELRFSKNIRTLASVLYVLTQMTYIPVVIYGPAMAINQVSGIHVHTLTTILCSICIFYTTLGGLKAVVWADALQAGLMILSVIAVAILGAIRVGGVGEVMQSASQGGRLQFFDMDADPSARMTFWASTLGLFFLWTSNSGISPAAVQRYISLPSITQARWSIFFLVCGSNLFLTASGVIGLVIYAAYKNCDPFSLKVISRPDQIVPYFVLDVAGQIKGLPALFLAGVVSAALSTMSTGLNTVAGAIYEDFVQPCFRTKVSEARASRYIKMLVVILGIICLLFVLVIEKLGAILELSASAGGMTSGAVLGIFILGLFFPCANAKGAMAGGLCSLVTTTWCLIGFRISSMKGLIKYPAKEISVLDCPANVTAKIGFMPASEPAEGYVFPLYRLSIFYYSLVGCSVAVAVGLAVSLLTASAPPEHLHPDLFSPYIHGFLPQKSKLFNSIPTTDENNKTQIIKTTVKNI